MGHNPRCENAKGTRCKCSCHGFRHGRSVGGSGGSGGGGGGGGAGRAGGGGGGSGGGAGGGGSAGRGGARRTTVEHADGFRTYIEPSMQGYWDSLSPSIDGSVYKLAALIADGIAAELGRPAGRASRRNVQIDHTLCSEMVAMVKALTRLSEMLPEAFGAAIEKAVSDMGKAGQLNAESAGKIAKIIARRAQDAATGGGPALYIEFCRYVAIVSCPSIVEHGDVWTYCFRPLLQDRISEEARDLVKDMLAHWNRIDDVKVA
jgi:hypothetical protein